MGRALAYYFLIGGLLFAGKSLWDREEAPRPEVTVKVPADASAARIEEAAREAILLAEARRYGWDRTDPVVFNHLVRNMRFVDPDTDADDVVLYGRALEMGMHRHDPIVRARLLYRAREALAFVPEERLPSREALEAHRTAHPERFEREGRARFHHVFLSKAKRGDAIRADAVEIREALSGLGPEPPQGIGDPLPGLRPEQVAAPSKIRDTYGEAVASMFEDPAIGVWRGPAPSVYGLHFIRVIEQEPGYVPPLRAIGAEVRADLLREIRDDLKRERMQALRDAYVVHVERAP